MATSFQKKLKDKVFEIPGTRPSLRNRQLLVSSGIPSLDNVIGGGLAVGTILLVKEDQYGSYSKMILKYFLAEGIMNKHDLFLASADTNPKLIVDELPGPIIDDPGADIPVGQCTETSESMKIAWRYQHQPQVQSAASGLKFGHYYDLTKTMDPGLIDGSKKMLVDVAESTECICGANGLKAMKPAYARVLHDIKTKIEEGEFSTSTQHVHRNILRIGIHSLGSPQWGEDAHLHDMPSLCRFIYALRAIMRCSYAVCLLTIPTHLYQDTVLLSRVEHLSDLVVHLESFVGSDKEKNPAFRDYHGLFHLDKLPRLNSLICHMPDTFDLAFKLRKKKLMIEKLHLPPELSDTVSRSQEDTLLPRNILIGGAGGGCGSAAGGTSRLAF